MLDSILTPHRIGGMKRQLLSSKRYAELRGWSRQYVHRLIKNGRLEAVKFEGNYYVYEDTQPIPVKMGRPQKK